MNADNSLNRILSDSATVNEINKSPSWFEKKTYLSFDAKTKNWSTKELNAGQRMLRTLFGAYKDTHQVTVQQGLREYTQRIKAVPVNKKTTALVQLLFKFKMPSESSAIASKFKAPKSDESMGFTADVKARMDAKIKKEFPNDVLISKSDPRLRLLKTELMSLEKSIASVKSHVPPSTMTNAFSWASGPRNPNTMESTLNNLKKYLNADAEEFSSGGIKSYIDRIVTNIETMKTYGDEFRLSSGQGLKDANELLAKLNDLSKLFTSAEPKTTPENEAKPGNINAANEKPKTPADPRTAYENLYNDVMKPLQLGKGDPKAIAAAHDRAMRRLNNKITEAEMKDDSDLREELMKKQEELQSLYGNMATKQKT